MSKKENIKGAAARGIVAARAVRSTVGAEYSDAVRARQELAREVLKPRIARRHKKSLHTKCAGFFYAGSPKKIYELARRANKSLKNKTVRY